MDFFLKKSGVFLYRIHIDTVYSCLWMCRERLEFPISVQDSSRGWTLAKRSSKSSKSSKSSMDAIKKKMQAMKVEKDNAMDRSDACEQAAKDAKVCD